MTPVSKLIAQVSVDANGDCTVLSRPPRHTPGNTRLDGKVVRLQREFRDISTTKYKHPKTGAITYSYKMGKVGLMKLGDTKKGHMLTARGARISQAL